MHSDATRKITEVVTRNGGRAYFVGGCVRDKFMGKQSKDRDLLVTGLTTDKLLEILPGKVDAVGKSFGVLKVTVPGEKRRCPQDDPGCGCQDGYDETVDVALPRTESSFGSGHRDFTVVANPNLSVTDDLARRDFTMNAIAIDANTNEMIDPFGGFHHMRQFQIFAVGNAFDRFMEDPLRMLRAVRFAAKLEMSLSIPIIDAIKNHKHLLLTISPERIYEELCRLLAVNDGNRVAQVIDFMGETGMMRYIIPEYMDSIGFKQNNPHHYATVDQHVLDALEYAIDHGASPRARLAVLLHDIAKPMCYTEKDGKGHFYGHELKGAGVALQRLTALRAPADTIKGVAKIIENHLRPPYDASDKTLRKFVAHMGELTEDALMCKESDMFAHVDGEAGAALIRTYRERIKGFAEMIGFTQNKLALDGKEIMELFKVQGKAVGELKVKATNAVIEGRVPNEREAIIAFLRS